MKGLDLYRVVKSLSDLGRDERFRGGVERE